MSPTTHRSCATFGCPHYTSRTYCSDCEALRERQRNEEPHRRIYSTWAWRGGTRPTVLRRDDYTCADCGWRDDTETGENLHADHVIDVHVLLDRGADPFDPDVVVTRCHSCHSRKTARTTIA